MANSVDPDEMPHSAASHLGLYCLLKPVCPNTYGKYGNRRNDFMFNLNESYVAEVGFKFLTLDTLVTVLWYQVIACSQYQKFASKIKMCYSQ